MDIERIYHRDDPIQLGAPPGKPPHDYSYMRSVMKSAMIHDALVATGLPGVEGVWAHEAGGGRQLLAVAIHQQYAGHARQAGSHLAAAGRRLHEQVRGRRRRTTSTPAASTT